MDIFSKEFELFILKNHPDAGNIVNQLIIAKSKIENMEEREKKLKDLERAYEVKLGTFKLK